MSASPAAAPPHPCQGPESAAAAAPPPCRSGNDEIQAGLALPAGAAASVEGETAEEPKAKAEEPKAT